MILIENAKTYGWEAAIHGMRNPMNSWDKSDSCYEEYASGERFFHIGENDLKLMIRLAVAGPEHRKFMRFITVTADITAPLYWWKEYDTYKVGTVANSCSTMHKIHSRDLTLDDFSTDHLSPENIEVMKDIITVLNRERQFYINGAKGVPGDDWEIPPKDKSFWWQMIQLLPSSYNQKRTVMLNYETLCNIYWQRFNHKLDEWQDFCEWMHTLPNFELLNSDR